MRTWRTSQRRAEVARIYSIFVVLGDSGLIVVNVEGFLEVHGVYEFDSGPFPLVRPQGVQDALHARFVLDIEGFLTRKPIPIWSPFTSYAG